MESFPVERLIALTLTVDTLCCTKSLKEIILEQCPSCTILSNLKIVRCWSQICIRHFTNTVLSRRIFYFFKMDNICETHCRRSQQQQMPSQQQLRMLRQPTKLYRRLPNASVGPGNELPGYPEILGMGVPGQEPVF